MPSPSLCVFCRQRAAEDRYRPFCSERCKMADLGRWLKGAYAVPGQPASGTDHPVVDSQVDDDEDRVR